MVFSHVKIVYATRGPKKVDKKEEMVFFYGTNATLGWDPDWWRWVKATISSTISQNLVNIWSLTCSMV